jgi:hypothetical protein
MSAIIGPAFGDFGLGAGLGTWDPTINRFEIGQPSHESLTS